MKSVQRVQTWLTYPIKVECRFKTKYQNTFHQWDWFIFFFCAVLLLTETIDFASPFSNIRFGWCRVRARLTEVGPKVGLKGYWIHIVVHTITPFGKSTVYSRPYYVEVYQVKSRRRGWSTSVGGTQPLWKISWNKERAIEKLIPTNTDRFW